MTVPNRLETAHLLLNALWLPDIAVCPITAAIPTILSHFTAPSDNAVGVSESISLIV